MIKPLSDNLKNNYSSAKPFPHIILDDFINDNTLLDVVISELHNNQTWGMDPVALRYGNQVKKFFMPWDRDSVAKIPPATKFLLTFFNSENTLSYLSQLTGIPKLIPDPNFVGGGVHKTTPGGKLNIHSDYALHPWETRLFRRVNVLFYLNKDWNPSWGGELHLLDFDTREKVKEVLPIYNRAVIFNTTTKSLHGHPEPLACPEDRYRLSLALYYFTLEPPESPGSSTGAVWY